LTSINAAGARQMTVQLASFFARASAWKRTSTSPCTRNWC
jgi:hypothetical protein